MSNKVIQISDEVKVEKGCIQLDFNKEDVFDVSLDEDIDLNSLFMGKKAKLVWIADQRLAYHQKDCFKPSFNMDKYTSWLVVKNSKHITYSDVISSMKKHFHYKQMEGQDNHIFLEDFEPFKEIPNAYVASFGS